MSQIQATNIQTPQVRYLSEKKVAEITGFSLSKLQQDRFYRKGIPYIKIGRNIRYELQEVVAFMESHKVCHD